MDKKVKVALNELINELSEITKKQSNDSREGLSSTVESIARLVESPLYFIPVTGAMRFVVPAGGGEDE